MDQLDPKDQNVQESGKWSIKYVKTRNEFKQITA